MFYISGITGIINEWVAADCIEDVVEMAKLIEKMVVRRGGRLNESSTI